MERRNREKNCTYKNTVRQSPRMKPFENTYKKIHGVLFFDFSVNFSSKSVY
ncbi:hypothetical protein CAEBREN_02771 [Caenorhabditis brenneri]|uniref:Uncharacterized protein n=1 Tax=Caenorhabditis brenneri TaxID=135651 RepID=G0N2Z9_CAEBE|nr:hypothetical protein CAEBREN_02771 [Caenorhabditis brenneri]